MGLSAAFHSYVKFPWSAVRSLVLRGHGWQGNEVSLHLYYLYLEPRFSRMLHAYRITIVD
jgi:hypothetical protein